MSDAARASLASVRAAQDAARGRARRETRRTRAWVGGILGGIAVGFLFFGPRVNRPEAARKAAAGDAPVAAASAKAAVAPPPPSTTTAQISPSASAVTAGDDTSAAATGSAAVTAHAVHSPGEAADPIGTAPASSPEAVGSGSSDDACAASFGQHRWRLSVEACTQAFQAHPRDATLALKIAHAHHARARLPEAGEWATRALALDPGLAEAYVIVAHAERHAGRPTAAVEAYRRYLTLAPRGWHASEARAAVRAHGREKSAHDQHVPSFSGTAAAATGAMKRSGG